ncbi:MAG: GNAT family N-acetyltransferase [Anaerotruncus sp.]|nr:GNAT family N-acetyltransferase [Anaerotruncus sp.]
MKRLTTPRLELREWKLEDAPDMFAYASPPTVGPAAGWPVHQSLEESETIIRRFIQSDDTWAVVLKSENKVIGSVGPHAKTDLKGHVERELGYVLSTPYEGHGLMTEACQAVIAYAFDELKCARLRVYHFIANEKSRRVIEKCGFVYEHDVDYTTHDGQIRQSKGYFSNPDIFNQRRTS